MSQPPHQHQHQHQHHPDDYKSSSSSSTSSSTDAITSTLAQLELEQERFHYPSSQYAYLSNDVTTRSMGVAAFTEPPVFRSTDVSNLNKDEYHNTWQTSSTGAKDLNLSSGYSRETDAQHLDPKSHTTSYTTSSTSSSSSTTLSRDDELRQSLRDMIPLDNPGYVEACYHFKFTMSPVEMYITLLKILDQLRVDTSIPDIKQYKIICRSYHDGIAIPFIVRIWKPVRDDNNTVNTEYWCEFQRRSGDILYFSELYHQCVKAVSTGNIESACIPPRTILPGIDDVVASPDEMAETLKCFMQMAASPCNDIKTQGILALSELSSQNDTTRDLMIQHGGLETFLKSLMNTSEDVQRGATTGLANLAQGTHADRVASTFTADASRLARLSYNANASQQLIRESARALYNIGMALGASRCDATFRNTVKSFHATDPQAKQHIHRLVTQLQIC